MSGVGVRHQHFSIDILAIDNNDPFQVATKGYEDTFLGCLEVFGFPGTRTCAYNWDPKAPASNSPEPETIEEKEEFKAEKTRQSTIRKLRRRGRMVSAYFPMLQFGNTPSPRIEHLASPAPQSHYT